MSSGMAGGIQKVMHFFLPKEEDFFELFVAMSVKAHEGAELLAQVLRGQVPAVVQMESIEVLEDTVDHLRHDCIKRLNDTFVTPIMFDRQDIIDLAHDLDEVVDQTRAAIDRMALYVPREIPPAAVALGEILVETAAELETVCAVLAKLRNLNTPQIAKIYELETRGDRVLKQGLADLFHEGAEPLEVIKWKEIYDYIEEAIDCCEDVAQTIEAALVKNS